MNFAWYIHRLRNMEPAEVLHRVQEKARRHISRLRHQGWDRYPAIPHHPVLSHLPAAMLSATPEQQRAVETEAATILAGRFAALGYEWPMRSAEPLFPPELWRQDPVKGVAWPDAATYAFDIDFRHDGSRGDIKYVWEINRLHMLPLLAVYWRQTEDPRALKAIEAAIASWHQANPPFGGVAWASGIEVAIRAINLIVTLDLAADGLSAAARQQMGQILSASAFWLPRFPSRFSSANNHLVAELAGEYLLSLALGNPREAARLGLMAELEKQILPDGSGAEQTPTYAAFTAETVLLGALAARQAGEPFSGAANRRLAAFADFISWLGPVRFGDDDEGRVLTFGREADYAGSVAAAINGLLERPGLPPAPDDIRSLFYGRPPSAIERPHGLRTFADGGLSLWRGNLAGRLVELGFDHGPLGYLSIAAHGHADALSLSLALDGRPILVDPGTWAYGSGGAWRSWFRSTPAHNTLNLDGASQSLMSGAFNWSHKAEAALLRKVGEPDWLLEAEHDGYQRRYGVRHRRRLQRVGDTIEVTDFLLGVERPAELVFQLAPDLDVAVESNQAIVRHDGTTVVQITFPPGELRVASGGDLPGSGGFVSPRFGERIPAPRIAWHGTIGAGGVTTRLCPARHPDIKDDSTTTEPSTP